MFEVRKHSHKTRGKPLLGFTIHDGDREVWRGDGFIEPDYRAASIQVALRELNGQPPVIAGENILDRTAMILADWSRRRFPEHAA
jgi:hypothetical protein